MPLSAVVADDGILGVLQPGEHGSTFGGNPLACAVARAALRVLVEEGMVENAARVGARLQADLESIAAPSVKEVRGRGLMIAIEFVRPGTSEPDSAATLRVFDECRKGGLLVGKGGLYGNVVRLGPPLTLTEEEAREGLAILTHAIATADAEARVA